MNSTLNSQPPAIGDNILYLKCINVGMGDCSLIIMPNGKRVLVDCGTSRLESADVDEIRRQLSIGGYIMWPFEIVVMTHPDRDHYSLIGEMLGDTYIKQLVHSMDLRLFGLYKFRTWYWRERSNIGSIQQVTVNQSQPNEVILLDGGRGIQLLVVAANVAYPGQSLAMKFNTASVVIVARDTTRGENLFLIAADGTCTTEDFMLDPARVGGISRVTVMRVGHHGSDTSSSQAFVEATNPSHAALVSSSRNNGKYCLPKESVVDRWLNQLPDASTDKTVGYWKDGDGVECRGNNSDEADLDTEPEGVETPYTYGTVQVRRRFYETFLDGTKQFSWLP